MTAAVVAGMSTEERAAAAAQIRRRHQRRNTFRVDSDPENAASDSASSDSGADMDAGTELVPPAVQNVADAFAAGGGGGGGAPRAAPAGTRQRRGQRRAGHVVPVNAGAAALAPDAQGAAQGGGGGAQPQPVGGEAPALFRLHHLHDSDGEQVFSDESAGGDGSGGEGGDDGDQGGGGGEGGDGGSDVSMDLQEGMARLMEITNVPEEYARALLLAHEGDLAAAVATVMDT